MADFVYPPVIAFARSMFKVQGLKFDIRGTEHVPRQGGALLVSNHIGYLDFVFCGLTALPSKRLVRFMAKESVFRHKVSGPLMRAMKHIPVDRAEGMHAYGHALDALRGGEIIGVFPEATISQSFTLKSFKSGAARLAMEAGVPLLPMALWGTQRLWTKGHPRNLGRSKLPITLRVGEQMRPHENEKAGALTRRLRLRVQELLEDAQRAYPAKPSGPADHWWQPAHLGGGAPTAEEAAAREREQQPLTTG
ncbi:lysophospholipid acyltransferase family protein [Actinacidiphila alni]|uniref:1-acyl-sn-glycerol-3-phosphate acyltransferases n=1 Tax=Actinacidiphila alni TaxID=380248 RepID=A0A1I2JVK7_9ACTN|nr:lysophospholipid acyltransferase family protein [Actinacidiphila alni]SFF57107.1 1-acyl-sn-glycerol-3-phosphate acyltransferases [Actinacidiphila alni]